MIFATVIPNKIRLLMDSGELGRLDWLRGL